MSDWVLLTVLAVAVAFACGFIAERLVRRIERGGGE